MRHRGLAQTLGADATKAARRVTEELAYMRLDADSRAVPWQVVQRAHIEQAREPLRECASRTAGPGAVEAKHADLRPDA